MPPLDPPGRAAGEETDLSLRPAEEADAGELADLYLSAREAAYPSMPRDERPASEVHAWFREESAETRSTWVAEDDGGVVGLLVLEGDWLHSLYVRPDRTGQGVGSLLVGLAKGLRSHGLGLWVFGSNDGARRFYRRHGFLEVRCTAEGSHGEGPAAEVEMAWLGEDPLAALRRRIDHVDDELASLLDQRAALTALAQQVKAGGSGRDAGREAEIADRMGAAAPHLGPVRMREIMHAVITQSLDAASADDGIPPRRPPGT